MWRLNDFWWVIFPVPVTLNLFLALELVLTFGICHILLLHPAGVPHRRKLMEPCGQSRINRETGGKTTHFFST
jgi:hypothetical protein